MMVSLQTDRLTLRPCVLDDFEQYAAMWAEPEVVQFLAADGKPRSRFDTWQSFCSQVGHWQLRGFGMFTVLERSTGNMVGRVGPWFPEGWPDFEIGWTLRSQDWGRGYATEAAQASIEYAFTDLHRPHVISLIAPGNIRSIRVAERVGEQFQCEVALPHLPEGRLVRQDGLTEKDWRARLRSSGSTRG